MTVIYSCRYHYIDIDRIESNRSDDVDVNAANYVESEEENKHHQIRQLANNIAMESGEITQLRKWVRGMGSDNERARKVYVLESDHGRADQHRDDHE